MEDTLSNASPIDLTKSCIFVMVKPGFLDYTDKIIAEFASETNKHKAWTLARKVTKVLTLDEAKQIYGRQENCFWYEDGCEYLASDESTGLLFTRETAMNEQQDFLEVFVIKCELRDRYNQQVKKDGDVKTLLHTADDLNDVKLEAPIYFGEDVFMN